MEEAGVKVLLEPVPLKKPDCVFDQVQLILQTEDFLPFGLPQSKYIKRRFLAEYSKNFKTVAIVGSHGKTTTSGLLSWALRQINFNFSYLVGGRFKNDVLPIGNFQDSPWLVVEVDESDGTIEKFTPDITVVLNCDWIMLISMKSQALCRSHYKICSGGRKLVLFCRKILIF